MNPVLHPISSIKIFNITSLRVIRGQGAKRLFEEGRIKEHDILVSKVASKWAKDLLRLAGASVTVTGSEKNYAAHVEVIISDPIDTMGLTKEEMNNLSESVRSIIMSNL